VLGPNRANELLPCVHGSHSRWLVDLYTSSLPPAEGHEHFAFIQGPLLSRQAH
jgi:hypothetical protein